MADVASGFETLRNLCASVLRGEGAAPPLGAEHYVRPEPGLLALFPSYMWHGTVPFGGEEPRLTIAFDIVPQPAAAPTMT